MQYKIFVLNISRKIDLHCIRARTRRSYHQQCVYLLKLIYYILYYNNN
jgi:hypothetical protein